jgi:anti-sigma regulatory factor (Ser/Thr protein kinase)
MVVILSFLVSLKQSRTYQITVSADVGAQREAVAFARGRSEALDWRGADLSRLELALEEAFLYQVEKAGKDSEFQIPIMLRSVGEKLELEFVSAPGSENLESLVAAMEPVTDFSDEDIRLRILSNMVEDISRQQFNDLDYLSILITPRSILIADQPPTLRDT